MMNQPFQSSQQMNKSRYSATSPQQLQNQQVQYPSNDTMQQGSAEEVIAVRKNEDGDIVELKLSSGRVVDYKTAQAMVKNNEIRNLNVFRGRDGEEHLRSNPDGIEANNLDNLPTF